MVGFFKLGAVIHLVGELGGIIYRCGTVVWVTAAFYQEAPYLFMLLDYRKTGAKRYYCNDLSGV